MEHQELSFNADGNANSTTTLEDSVEISYTTKHTLTITPSNHTP